jgi:hypothetical protein
MCEEAEGQIKHIVEGRTTIAPSEYNNKTQ